MPPQAIDLKPVSHLTADAVGPAGKRIFYLQGHKETRTLTLILEKFQLQGLSIGVEQFLAEIQEKFPDLPEASREFNEDNMRIHPPLDPLFRIGELALGYEAEGDLAILIAKEVVTEEADAEQARIVRFWCTRHQLRALAHWGLEVVSRGRPLCPQCGTPLEPGERHFCPKKNGHRVD